MWRAVTDDVVADGLLPPLRCHGDAACAPWRDAIAFANAATEAEPDELQHAYWLEGDAVTALDTDGYRLPTAREAARLAAPASIPLWTAEREGDVPGRAFYLVQTIVRPEPSEAAVATTGVPYVFPMGGGGVITADHAADGLLVERRGVNLVVRWTRRVSLDGRARMLDAAADDGAAYFLIASDASIALVRAALAGDVRSYALPDLAPEAVSSSRLTLHEGLSGESSVWISTDSAGRGGRPRLYALGLTSGTVREIDLNWVPFPRAARSLWVGPVGRAAETLAMYAPRALRRTTTWVAVPDAGTPRTHSVWGHHPVNLGGLAYGVRVGAAEGALWVVGSEVRTSSLSGPCRSELRILDTEWLVGTFRVLAECYSEHYHTVQGAPVPGARGAAVSSTTRVFDGFRLERVVYASLALPGATIEWEQLGQVTDTPLTEETEAGGAVRRRHGWLDIIHPIAGAVELRRASESGISGPVRVPADVGHDWSLAWLSDDLALAWARRKGSIELRTIPMPYPSSL